MRKVGLIAALLLAGCGLNGTDTKKDEQQKGTPAATPPGGCGCDGFA